MDNLGERIRDARNRAGMSVRALAGKVDVSPSFVSQIENGKSQPSVATLYAFARVLDISVDDLFGELGIAEDSAEHPGEGEGMHPADAWVPSEFSSRVSVIHPAHRSHLDMADGVRWERLAATPERGVAFMRIIYAPGAESTADGHPVAHDGYEYGYVLAGVLEVTVGAEMFVLRAGETIGFDSTIPHVLRNVGEEPFEGVWLVHSRRH